MKPVSIAILLARFAVLVVVGLSLARAVPFRDSIHGFSLELPRGWTEKTGLAEQTVLKLTKGQDGDKSVMLVTATRVNDGQISGAMTEQILAQLVNPANDALSSMKEGFEVVSVESVSVNGAPAIRAECRFSYIPRSGKARPIRKVDYYFVQHGYLLLFGVELAPDPAHEDDFMQCMSTLRFDDTARGQQPDSPAGVYLRLVKPGEPLGTALFNTLGLRALMYSVTALMLGAAVWLWRVARRRKKGSVSPRSSPQEPSVDRPSDKLSSSSVAQVRDAGSPTTPTHGHHGPVSKGFFLWSVAGAGSAGVVFVMTAALAVYGGSEDALMQALMLFGLALTTYAVVVLHVLIYRAWRAIQDDATRTTPGKAVGYLFIPAYNMYWVFVALSGYAREYNLYLHRSGFGLPRLGRAVFTTAAIMYPVAFAAYSLSSLGFSETIWVLCTFVYWVLMIAVADRLCNAINWLANATAQRTLPPGS